VLLTSCYDESGRQLSAPQIALYYLPVFAELSVLVTNTAAALAQSSPQDKHRTSGSARSLGSPSTVVPNAIGLLRQPDCSVTEYFLNSSLTTSSSSVQIQSTIPNFQDQLHKNQGLTTTPDKWPNGCKAVPGASASPAIYLGSTQSSQYIVAVINQATNGLYIGKVDPSGGTISTTDLTGAPDPASLATADLNGDGYNDLIVADTPYAAVGDPGGIFVFLSNGDGTFKAAEHYAVPYPLAMTVLDVNGDGKPDIVVAQDNGSTSGNLFVLLGNGDGTFRTPIAGPGIGGQYMAAADLNGDGKPDLAFDNGSVQLGNGDGTFRASVVTLPGVSGGGMPAISDFNNDGKIDVAILDPNGPFIRVYTGKGDGTFTTGPVYPAIYGTVNLGAADIDGDGNMDLIAGINAQGAFAPEENSSDIIEVMLGNGNGTFFNGVAYPDTTLGNFAVGDFNGDSKPDLLGAAFTSVGQSNGLQLLAGDGKGGFTPQAATNVGNPTWIAAADMNGDSKLDAVFADSGAAVGVALGTGSGTFNSATDYQLPNPGRIANLVTADFNGDGKPDVLVLSQNSSGLYLYLNNGNGTLHAPLVIDTPASPVGVAVGDLNGDGKPDIVVTNAGELPGNNGSSSGSPGSMEVYLAKGNGTFADPVSYTPGFYPGSVTIADLNKDGKLDILVNSVSSDSSMGTLSVYLGDGNGDFQTAQNTQLPDANVTNLAVADFNHDGNPDVLIGDCCGLAYTSIAFGKGDGTFLAVESSPLNLSSSWVTGADVNGDGLPDMLLVTATQVGITPANIQVFLTTSGKSLGVAQTSTTLAASATAISQGSSVTFTASVNVPAGSTTAPTGTVTFMDGTTTLGTGTVASGVATYNTSGLSAGTHSITAVYGGDSTYGASTSSAVSVTVTGSTSPPTGDFNISLSPASDSIAQGGTATTTISITPTGGFNHQVTFACSGLPKDASCSFSPSTVTPSGTSAATSTLTIKTDVTTALRGATPSGHGDHPSGPATLAFAFGAGLFGFSLFRLRRRDEWRSAFLSLAVSILVTTAAIAGCGGSGTKTPGGKYQLAVTASAGSDSHTANYALTVQ
jgi:hypothetical protein